MAGLNVGMCHIAVPPGATIEEQLEYREMTQRDLSVRMGMSEERVGRLINGEVRLTFECARRLELVLGIPAVFWRNLETHYRDQLARVAKESEKDEGIEVSWSLPHGEMAEFDDGQRASAQDRLRLP